MGDPPLPLRALLSLAAALVCGQLLHALGLLPWPELFTRWAFAAVAFVAVVSAAVRVARSREHRLKWTFFAIGLTSWSLGAALWVLVFDRGTAVGELALFLGLYPCAIGFVILDLRGRSLRISRGVVSDATAAVLAVAAFGLGVALPLAVPAEASITTLAFPVLDVALVGVVVVLFTIARWQPGRDWIALGAGLCALAIGDLLWVVQGSGWPVATATALWSAGVLVLGLVPWLRGRAAAPATIVAPRLPWPFAFFLGCLALVLAGNYVEVPQTGVWLAVASMLVTVQRTARTYIALRALPETRRQARTDELTGLTNRRGFFDALEQRLERHPRSPATVLMLDLDRFKELNDTMGHHTGDRLLAQLGPRLTSALRPADTLARLGGDEFAVLCPGAPPAGARRVAERLQAALDEPFALGDLQVHVDASVGIASFPEDGATPAELLQRADVAMYQAKGGRTEIEHYDPGRDGHSRDRLALIGELRRALDRGGELELRYQPQACLRTGRIVAVEALVRWPHPTRGLLRPDAFLDAAESAGLMRRIGSEVLALALAQAAAWRDAGIVLSVAVNLSTADLVDDTIGREILALLERHDLPGSRLKLEITENTVMARPDRAIATLHGLRALGCTVSLDDFGTGHASLAHLAALPVDELKIDRSFVEGLDAGAPGAGAIVRAVALLGRDLGVAVVAEGVESRAAWGQLVAAGATGAQGYLLSPPLAAGELETWLQARHAAALAVV